MIKKSILIVSILFTVITSAQENVASPYSFYGIGLMKFKGTVENRSMGGLSIYTDSIHVNLQNPASYGNLELTTYTIGASHKEIDFKSNGGEEHSSSSSIDYLAIGIPAGKFGFGFGLMPFSSVGYRLTDITPEAENRYYGRGGINRVFLSAGYQINDNFRLGLEANYNFGNIYNKSLLMQSTVQYGTREVNTTNLTGFSYRLGLNYINNISENLEFRASAYFTPSTDISSENEREISTVLFDVNGNDLAVDTHDLETQNSDMALPTQYSLGAGFGKKNKWFLGMEYSQIGASEFTNRSFTVDDASFENASSYKIGGFLVPEYNSLTNYFKKITYRAGFRFEETGLVKANEPINEFGISFGVGLPVGSWFSNANLGVEYGQRGTTAAGLVKEEFFNFSISLSLNDKWFVKRKFD
ncbi:MAG TPA: hypothetical protein VFM70_05940 [Salinimicrobium sp.]|nr:hypothetical protein [Salinimicrobium sp.]